MHALVFHGPQSMKFEKVESPDWYDSMPSTSDGLSPASSTALRTAQVPSARVVMPEPRM